jgi:phosphomannomutase
VISDPGSTDGWRGLPGPGWPEPALLAIVASLAAGGFLGAQPAVAFDGRAGSRELASLACDLLAGLGIRCLAGDEPSPTPALGRFVRVHPDVTGGLVFTASHNPPGYVGLKFRAADGLSGSATIGEPAPATIPASSSAPVVASFNAHYAATVGQQLLDATRGFDGTLIVDAAHGALGSLARHLRGISWARARPLPFFGGSTPDPVIDANIEAAWQAAITAAPEPERLLMAFTDGDGDRLVLATARSGYISSAEQAALICLAGIPADTLIATVVTPRFARTVARSAGLDWTEVPVGFKHVVTAWRGQSRPRAIGLEPNGALAYAGDEADYFERDAMRALALIMRALPATRLIDDATAALRAQHPSRPEIISSPLAETDVLHALAQALTGWEHASSGQLSSFTSAEHRFLVRPSGTEAVTRVYAEAPQDITGAVRAALLRSSGLPGPGRTGT